MFRGYKKRRKIDKNNMKKWYPKKTWKMSLKVSRNGAKMVAGIETKSKSTSKNACRNRYPKMILAQKIEHEFLLFFDVLLEAPSWPTGVKLTGPGWCRGVGGSTFNDHFHQIYVVIKFMNTLMMNFDGQSFKNWYVPSKYIRVLLLASIFLHKKCKSTLENFGYIRKTCK